MIPDHGGPTALFRRVGRAPLTLLVLWILCFGAHTWLVRRLADDSHAAAMLTAPTDATLMLGAVLVLSRICLFVVLPVSLSTLVGWRLGRWVFDYVARPADPTSTDARSTGA